MLCSASKPVLVSHHHCHRRQTAAHIAPTINKMPRKTRAAMRAEAEALNIDSEDAGVDTSKPLPPTPTKRDRSPLGNIDSNSVDGAASAKEDHEPQTEVEDLKTSKRGKGGKAKKGKAAKKGAKSKEAETEEIATSNTEEPTPADKDQATAAAEAEEFPEAPSTAKKNLTTYDKLEAIVTTPPTRLTRSQREKAGEDEDTEAGSEQLEEQPEQKMLKAEQPAAGVAEQQQLDSPTNEPEAETIDATQQDATQSTTVSPLPLSPMIPQLRPEDSIDAIDAMEDAFEQVNKMIPQVDPTSPEKPVKSQPVSKESAQAVSDAKIASAKMTQAFKARKAAATTSVTAPAKRNTTASKPAAPSNKTSVQLPNRTASQSQHGKSASVSTSRKPSSSSEDPSKDTNNKTTDYLASRRRPISMQFPAPAPPIKSTKAPTKSTFTLPGEAVAARLKAAREERLKREEEEAQKRREFKARYVIQALVASCYLRIAISIAALFAT